MNTTVKLSRTKDKIRTVSITVALIALFYVSFTSLDLDIGKFITRIGDAGTVLSKLMTIDLSNIGPILLAMLASAAIAICGLFIGLIIAIILSFLSASNITPNGILAAFIKGSVAVIRAVPALVWILMVVASLGFGSTAGMIGLIISTVGYLTKAFTASIEEQGSNIIEALKTTGAGWISIVIKGLLPSVIRPFMSWTAIKLEIGIAESINLGMVGVAGIGSMLMKSLGRYDYAAISTTIIVIFISMLIVEIVVNRLKKLI
ncbi:PhnE/PtxC family ABC transporter permease [Paenibacillus senegalimassiliensis]|uniref:PhnE/PtxC family ABC transporter permease n=1 Tax=Paenibacillus senegalimassiliensis TaxID=1737426 RepID=UPI00073ED979|nr:ABC transporter permease subunit [Paenibacillus senegalimassiliensis]